MQSETRGSATHRAFGGNAGLSPRTARSTSAVDARTGHAARMPLARALGWLSVGIGLTQLLAPRRMARLTGIDNGAGLMRAVGLREVANGAGILIRDKPGWIWARVAGDAMDLALLGTAARSARHRDRLAWTAAAVAGIAALDVLVSVRRERQSLSTRGDAMEAAGAIAYDKALFVNRDPLTCYNFWRDLTNLPRFMQHVASVTIKSETLSHWVAKGPAGTHIEWDAEISAEEPGHLLAWHSTDNADVANAGTLRFEAGPEGHGTTLRVDFRYTPPAGKAGALIARLFGEEPALQMDDDLQRFKTLLETGEVDDAAQSPHAARGPLARLLAKDAPG